MLYRIQHDNMNKRLSQRAPASKASNAPIVEWAEAHESQTCSNPACVSSALTGVHLRFFVGKA